MGLGKHLKHEEEKVTYHRKVKSRKSSKQKNSSTKELGGKIMMAEQSLLTQVLTVEKAFVILAFHSHKLGNPVDESPGPAR